jgi:metal-dependent hydrolase (beta-lactamase superfamily II)
MRIIYINYSQIDTILISHNHGDHEGDLLTVPVINIEFRNYFLKDMPRVDLGMS